MPLTPPSPPAIILSLSRVWDDAAAALRAGGPVLVPVAALFFFLPSLAVAYLMPPPPRAPGAELTLADIEAMLLPQALIAPVLWLGQLCVAALLVRPGAVTVREAVQTAMQLFLPMAMMSVLIGFVALGGLLLFILPGIYLVGRLMTATPILVTARQGAVAALEAGWQQTTGNGLRIALLLVLVYVAALVAVFAIGGAGGTILLLIGRTLGLEGLGVALATALTTAVQAGAMLVMALIQVMLWRQLGGSAMISDRG